MKHAIITDTNVAELYGKKMGKDLFIVPAGEQSKSLQTYQTLLSQLILAGYGRETTIIALGGGMITDLAGFVASTFCRGVPLILIPTTLLAMVDAAIGGKTALNLPEGKNLIGSYYVPEKILLHPPFLETLPAAEWENGIAEILKLGLISDPDLFYYPQPLEKMILRAIEGKRRIVAQDPQEKGCRTLLNLGHTIGHALETLSNYTLSHGRAVSFGIVLEARLSSALGLLPHEELAAIEARFPPVSIPFNPERIIEQLKRDKKSQGGIPHFVLLERVGRPYLGGGRFCHPVPESLLTQVLYTPIG